MSVQPRPRGPVLWMIAPKRALAREAGLTVRQAGKLIRLSRRRGRARVALVVLVQVGTMVGWVALVSATAGIYETVTLFGPDGTLESETTTGPFGITVMPLFFGVLLGPFMALVLGAVVGLAMHFLLVDREAKRCVRTPACFGCGYDLSTISGRRCPECGLVQTHLAPNRSATGRTVVP